MLMLLIEEHQIKALASSVQNSFIERLILHLNQSFPKEIINFEKAELKAEIKCIMEQSFQFGFFNELEVASISEYVLIYKLDLEKDIAKKVVLDEKMCNDAKLALLGDLVL
jgi:hypothetical protein